MASAHEATVRPGPGRRWLARARRAGLAVAVAVSVAGCVGMPNSGSPGTFSATPQDTTPDSNFIGAIPAGPQANWKPTEIVTGFLNASANYPVYKEVAWQYLVNSAVKTWDPGWSVEVVDQVDVPHRAEMSTRGSQAIVDVTGTVRASFNGTGQYVGPQQSHGGALPEDQIFKLVKVNGQWRITNPPKFRMLTEPDFSQVYKPQDLYFFDPAGQVLVPDAVFVPSATPPTTLVTNLVGALLNNPQPQWLRNGTSPPAVTEFPSGTRLLSPVAIDGTTATVNLGGAVASATPTVREQISAQLVWTLTGQQSSLNIQAVQLEINGKAWTPSVSPCAGTRGQSQSPTQKQFMYGCYNPYPAATSAAFYYVSNGQAWSRCASESQVMTGFIGPVVPVFNRRSAARIGQRCVTPVIAGSPAMPPPQPRGLPPLSMVAVSPDGKYMAGVLPGGKTVEVWASGGAKPFSSLTTSDVTAISWDGRDYLWVAHGSSTTIVVPTSNSSNHTDIPNAFDGKIIGLGIAPNGVRVAAVVQTGSGPEVELAAIADTGQPSGQLSNPSARTSIGQSVSIGPPVRLGPNIINPMALTWYDADNLLVLNGPSARAILWDVPVDGQPATNSSGVLPYAVSITANSAKNALVVGLSTGRMEVSASLEGPWQLLGSDGQNPAFPVPAIPSAAQS